MRGLAGRRIVYCIRIRTCRPHFAPLLPLSLPSSRRFNGSSAQNDAGQTGRPSPSDPSKTVNEHNDVPITEVLKFLEQDPVFVRHVADSVDPRYREIIAAALLTQPKADDVPIPSPSSQPTTTAPNPTTSIPLPIDPLHPAKPLSRSQLLKLFGANFIPFIGFGIVDNVIMLTCGDFIDSSLGVTLGISTLAAAGLGNIVSNSLGFITSDLVQAVALKMGLPKPDLEREQENSRTVRLLTLLFQILGICVGCLIGMFPLLFMDNHPRFMDLLTMSLSPEQKLAMNRAAERITYQFGDFLLEHGCAGEYMFFILSGSVEILGRDVNGHPIIVSEEGPGGIIGELEMLTRQPCIADVVAKGKVVALRLHRADFLRCMGQSEDVLKGRIRSASFDYARKTYSRMGESDRIATAAST